MADGTIAPLSNWDTWGVFGVLTVVNLVVLLYRTRYGAALRPAVQRLLHRLSGRSDLGWLDWRPLLVMAAIWFGGFSAYGILSGQYGCQPGILSDALGVMDSGRAFWAGGDPFSAVPYCGGTLLVPYGLAAVLLDALGSLGGLTGICIVWGAVVLSILPLTWAVGGDDRRYITVFVASSILFVPLATSEFGGATNAIVPMTLLLTLYLAERREVPEPVPRAGDGRLGAAAAAVELRGCGWDLWSGHGALLRGLGVGFPEQRVRRRDRPAVVLPERVRYL